MKILLHNTADKKGSFGVRCQTRYCLSSTITPLSWLFLFFYFWVLSCRGHGLTNNLTPGVIEAKRRGGEFLGGEETRRMEAERQCHSTLRLAGMSTEWHWAGRPNFARESTEIKHEYSTRYILILCFRAS